MNKNLDKAMVKALFENLEAKEARYAEIAKVFWEIKADGLAVPAIIREKVIAAKAEYKQAEDTYNDYVMTGIDPILALLQA